MFPDFDLASKSKMALIRKGKVCFSTFLGGFCIFLLSCVGAINTNFQYFWDDFWPAICLLFIVIYNVFLYVLYCVLWTEKNLYEVCTKE